MTPEEAKPRTMLVVNKAHHQPNYEVQGFTAKETAEIAKAYAQAYYEEEYSAMSSDAAERFRKLFKEWGNERQKNNR